MCIVSSYLSRLPYKNENRELTCVVWQHIKKSDSMNHVKLIEFYSESCANCKSFVKEYKELAKQLKGVIRVTAVNCDKEKKICDEYDVKTYPTLKVIPPGGFGMQDYSGERTSKAVYPWVMKFFSHFVEKVTAENHEAFLNKNAGKFKTLLFTDKPKTPLLWRGVRSPNTSSRVCAPSMESRQP